MNMNRTVLISCPIQNRSWILDCYLKHIEQLNYPKESIHIYWLVNNSTDDSLKKLKAFRQMHINEYASIEIEVKNSPRIFKDERSTQTRMDFTYEWLSFCRNRILQKCVDKNADYLFSCDSDILPPPNAIKDLLSYGKDCVVSLIYNGYELFENEFWRFPNILKKNPNGGYTHIVNHYTSNPSKCPREKLVQCDFSGAVFLCSQEVCKNSSYSKGLQGEDERWSESLISAGYEIWCSPYVFSKHIMSPKFLAMYLDNTYPMR